MSDPISFYQHQVVKYSEQLQLTKNRLYTSSLVRLFVFILAAIVIYFFFDNSKVIIATILVTIVIFLYLVSRHTDLQDRQKLESALTAINETEIEVLNRNFH